MVSPVCVLRPERAALSFFFSGRRRHTMWTGDWSSDVCSSDLLRLLSDGNTLGEAFLFLAAAPLGFLAGAVVGALLTVRVLSRLRERPASVAGRREQKRMRLGQIGRASCRKEGRSRGQANE